MSANFADRFFWARHRAAMGAPAIAEATGCGQGLVFSIEKGDGAHSSKFNDKFAKAFGVDRNWLRTGEEPVPEGYDPLVARRERMLGSRRGGRVIQFADFARGGDTPTWAPGGVDMAGLSKEQRAEILQRRIINDFQDYSKTVSPKATHAFIQLLGSMASLMAAVASEEAERNGD